MYEYELVYCSIVLTGPVFFCLLNFQAAVETTFDDLFGTSAAIDPFNFNSQNGMRKDDK